MAKKKTINDQIKIILIAIADLIKGIFGIFSTVVRAIAYLIRDVFTALEKFAKVIAILMLSFTGSVLILATAFYMFTSTLGLKDSPIFQDIRDRMATLYVTEIEEDIKNAEERNQEELNNVE